HRGEGSIAMLERLLPAWVGKLFVLVLLGFAATDFLITMTLSAADATAHLVSNPLVPAGWSDHNLLITLGLLALLGGVFLRGFSAGNVPGSGCDADRDACRTCRPGRPATRTGTCRPWTAAAAGRRCRRWSSQRAPPRARYTARVSRWVHITGGSIPGAQPVPRLDKPHRARA
ncbi:MAG TPA: hypothetical protein VIJ00_17610, partial [Nakamurella sp.]